MPSERAQNDIDFGGGVSSRETPLCLRCLSPHSPDARHCPRCGAVVWADAESPIGAIPLDEDVWTRAWHAVRYDSGVSFTRRALYAVLLAIFAPAMLVAPAFLWAKRRMRHRSGSGREGS